ncbi:hypothetical protein EGI22_14025, partial [Lacihabitans sp. LS3-19]|nr:hypothetical protein [Lacihabitans sp. LS3-19]
MSIFTSNKKKKFILPKILLGFLLFFGFNNPLQAQTGTFSWWNGTSGQTWAYTDVSKTFPISCGPGCTVNVTMTIVDPNNRNADNNILNPHPYGDVANSCGWGATGGSTFDDPWDSSCGAGNPFSSGGLSTETSGAYGLGFLTYAIKTLNHLENVTIRYTFSKPVFMNNFTVGDIDGRTLTQDRNDNLFGIPTLDVRELPGNSFQDEMIFSAAGPSGNVPVTLTPGVTPNLMIISGQTARSVYNNSTINLAPTDGRGTITVSTSQAITSLDITYSNGAEDAAEEQANPAWYSWWSSTHGATNGVSDDQAVRLSGFTFTACPDFTFTKTDATVCEGQTANIGVSTSNGTSPYSYSWTGPNSFTSTLQNPSISNVTSAEAGVYTVLVTDAATCFFTATASITVNALPVPNPGTNSPVCVGQNINLTSSGGISYQWTGPNGFSSNSQNPTINNAALNQSGNYAVTVTNALGCTASAQVAVSVNPLPTPAAGNDSPVCEGGTVNLNASGGTSYSWSGPDGFSSNSQNPQISNIALIAGGIYTVTVTDANGCTATAQTTVTVNPLPNPIAGNDSPVCEGGTVNLNASGGTSYSWSGPDGFSSNSQNPQISNIALIA